MPRTVEAPGLKANFIVEGTHNYDPPVGQVLMSDPRAPYFERPMGFYSEDLRRRFIDASVRIAGVGGGGFTLAVMLAKEGVRDFSIADVEQVDASNVGRIPLLAPEHIGREKSEVAAELITYHNPTARVRVYRDGIQTGNVDEFLGFDAGNSGVTVGFDEIELKEPQIALWFHRAARRHGRYVISATDVERGGMVTTYDPTDLDHTFEHCSGARPTDSVEQYLRKVKGFQLPTIANVPKSGDIRTLLATQSDAPLPTTLRSVLNATDLAMDEFEKLLTLGDKRYGQPHCSPEVHCVNPSQGEDFVTKHPRVRCTARIAQLAVRHLLGRSPRASYGFDDRQRREEYRRQVAQSM